jgi:hypothetical protein
MRDKDLALAIKHVVENGADIINMALVRHFHRNKFVDDALKLAEKNV